MAQDPSEALRRRIQELEKEISEREKDLSRFRNELSQANTRLEAVLSQLNQELKTAQEIHKVLVPVEFPHISGFEFSSKFIPSEISGGDYFDIFEHEDRMRFGLMLASSSGHAMSALFLSVLLKFTGRIEARKGSEADQVLKLLSKELAPKMPEGAAADIFYGVVDRRNFQFSFCGLGQVTGLHQNFSNGELKMLLAPSPGLTRKVPMLPPAATLTLNPRDRLVLCSKGITEARNLNGETFGVARLSRTVLEGPKSGVHELRNHVLYELQKFTTGSEPERDRTVLVVEVKDKVIKLAKG